MKDNYVVGLTEDMTLKLLDVKRKPWEVESCVAISTASWKNMLRSGVKNYFDANRLDMFDGRPYYLGYGRVGYSVVNPGLGDYVAPGFTSISMPLGSAISEASTIISKGKFTPINGRKLINENFKFKNDRSNSSVYLNRGKPCNHTLPGWSVVHRSERPYLYLERAVVTDGPSRNYVTRVRTDNRYPNEVVLATQTIDKRHIEGATTIRVEVTGHPRGVIINESILTHVGGNIYEYNGPAFEGNVTLGIGIGALGVNSVRILDI